MRDTKHRSTNLAVIQWRCKLHLSSIEPRRMEDTIMLLSMSVRTCPSNIACYQYLIHCLSWHSPCTAWNKLWWVNGRKRDWLSIFDICTFRPVQYHNICGHLSFTASYIIGKLGSMVQSIQHVASLQYGSLIYFWNCSNVSNLNVTRFQMT